MGCLKFLSQDACVAKLLFVNSFSLIPLDIISHYKTDNLVDCNGCVHMEIIRDMYGPQRAVILAKHLIAQCLGSHGY